jgi:ribose-phosphate pyrophosphokinase
LLSFAPFTLSPQEIANYLGMDLGGRVIKKFADGEVYVQIQESIRGCDVFLVQPTCPPNVNDNLMELLIMIDACRRASCRSITCVIPYYGYARADRRTSGRESIAAKLAANLLTEAGATRIVMLDIHSLQTIGYFDIPVDHIYGETVILDYLTSKDFDPDDLVVVSPDVGGVPRARAFAKKLCDAPLAIIDKRRTGHNKAEVMNLIGEVDGKVAIVLDDMIDTGGTICAGAKMLRERGAKEVYACATHAVFSPPAVERLGSGVFTEVIVTNSIPHVPERDFPQLTVLSVGNLARRDHLARAQRHARVLQQAVIGITDEARGVSWFFFQKRKGSWHVVTRAESSGGPGEGRDAREAYNAETSFVSSDCQTKSF